MKYVVLKSETQNGIKTLLVDKDTFKTDGAIPSDYFLGGPSNAKKIGEVNIIGDIDWLDIVYESQ